MSYHSFTFNSRRSDVLSTQGMVSSSQPLATQTGIDILKKGGNAADAAIATVACLNVTEPVSTGIGGDAFCLFYSAKDKTVRAINGSGRSPQAASLEKVLSELPEGSKRIPFYSPHAITVPGACAAMVDTVNIFGSGKFSMAEIFSPAIQLAEEGYPVSDITAHEWKKSEGLLSKAPNGHEMLLNGRAPNAGEIIQLPNLAKTYRTVAEKGKDGFYKGRIAEAIVAVIKRQGGAMSLDDLAAHFSEEVEAISYKFQDKVQVYECPPNGQGLTALIAMGLLDVLQEDSIIPALEDLDPLSPMYIHLLIEVLRIAFVDTRQHVTDPNFYHIPASQFLDKEYLRTRAKLFNPNVCSIDVQSGSPINGSNTVHLAVVDVEGNACSFIMSNYNGFGSCMIPEGWGFTLHNRGCNFSLEPNHPNRIEPRKRPYHTIIPAMVLTPDDELWLCYGVMGAFMQPQGQLMVLLNCLIGKMSPQRALDQPRFCISPDNGTVLIEPGFTDDTIAALQRMGHSIKLVSGYDRAVFGRGQMIRRTSQSHSNGTKSVVLAGGCDPRSDGQVAGF